MALIFFAGVSLFLWFRWRRHGRNTVMEMQAYAGTAAAATLWFGVTLSYLDNKHDASISPTVAAVIVCGFGVYGLFATLWFDRRPWPCVTDERLRAHYRTRFMLRVAFAYTPALIAFVLFFLTAGTLWVYFVGAAWTLGELAFAMPSRLSLARDERSFHRSGCSSSLIDALRGPRTASGGTGRVSQSPRDPGRPPIGGTPREDE